MEYMRPLRPIEHERLSMFFEKNSEFGEIVAAVQQQGARAYMVGGAVRDFVLGLPLKDVDIEVHDINLDGLRGILQNFGPVEMVGKSFGVLKLFGAFESDWSVPRADGKGRKPLVEIDPGMGIVQALRRRDLTMNAMAIDLHDWHLIDPYGGEDALNQKRLSCVDPETFIEDPLRFYRVMQFCARFECEPDEILNETCRSMDIRTVSRERIESECEKVFLWSKRPSLGFRWLERLGRLPEIFQELAVLVLISQNPWWHPEGNAFEHTMQTLDAAARVEGLGREKKLVLMYAALCHDLGKSLTTKHAEDGRLISHGHEQEGVPLARAMLNRVVGNKALIHDILLLVRHHMSPGSFVAMGAKEAAYKRLAVRLAPNLSLSFLAMLAEADLCGRNGSDSTPLEGPMRVIETFCARAQEYGVFEAPEKALLCGADLIPFIGEGPRLGEALKRAYEIQIAEGLHDKEKLRARVLKDIEREAPV
ncbi:MAG: Multifunctional CCA protein [candidate division TM6 bacterium GW2011_GWE2_42_60]|nr:MAG: Multifunctional CCA protein [candidate division TM6 bacterium GW2011_GWE2_42_60]HBY05512.1 hypothetical protein [Candidatus Dependentiae bacterium]